MNRPIGISLKQFSHRPPSTGFFGLVSFDQSVVAPHPSHTSMSLPLLNWPPRLSHADIYLLYLNQWGLSLGAPYEDLSILVRFNKMLEPNI